MQLQLKLGTKAWAFIIVVWCLWVFALVWSRAGISSYMVISVRRKPIEETGGSQTSILCAHRSGPSRVVGSKMNENSYIFSFYRFLCLGTAFYDSIIISPIPALFRKYKMAE